MAKMWPCACPATVAMAGSSLLHYVWDGKEVHAIDEDTLRSGNHVRDAGSMVRRAVLSWQDSIYKAFVPNTKDVTDDYWEWIKWRLTQVRVNAPSGHRVRLLQRQLNT
eukprot:359094-Chlamydomonas_euryale.AAC.7